MTKKYNKTYTNAFKRGAIKLNLESSNIIGAAKSLAIPEATLHTWARNARNSREQIITDSSWR